VVTTTVSADGRRIRRRRAARRDARAGWLFVLPVLLLFLVFRFGPTVAGMLLSLFSYSIGGDAQFTGVDNYSRLLGDATFWHSLAVTAEYAVIAVPVTILVSLVMALLTRRVFRGVRFFRSVFFLPVVTSLVLAGVIFTWIFSREGPWAALLGALGVQDRAWLASETFVVPAVAMVGVWTGFGYGMLVLLARLQSLPRELDEAAMVDGAGAWQRFRRITLPQLRPALFFVAILQTVTSFQAFDAIYVMTGGGPVHASYTLVFYLYDQGFKYFDQGYASAVGVALFLIILVVSLVQRRVLGGSD
jgi:multiple sugar transport system permease protein